MTPKCGDCFLYHERKKICPVDGKYRMKTNGCYDKFVAKDKKDA